MKAMICGSFDPVTRGHADLIGRAASLFDEVEVVMLRNSDKKYLFTEEERLGFLARVCAGYANVKTAASDATAAAYAVACHADCIVKGVRNQADFTYERDMADLNRLACGIETVFLPTTASLSFVSSGAVREFLSRGLSPEGLLPPEIAADVVDTYQKK